MNSDKYLLLFFILFHMSILAAEESLNRPAAIFGFGDSIVDPGNNNQRLTSCHSNHKPYGTSLREQKATGRFSDGKLPMDILINNLGIKKLLPAFHDPTVNPEALMTGVSFGAACSGLDDLTAGESGVASMTDQLKDFKEAVESMQRLVGIGETGLILDNSLFFVAAGTTDMLNNYYTVPLRKGLTLSGYHDLLLRNLEIFLVKLVGLGGVRIAVAGMPPIGCLPVQVTANSVESGSRSRECYADRNSDSTVYNSRLQTLISKLQSTLPRCRFGYVDFYTPLLHMVQSPRKYGFERTHDGCCGSGTVEMGLLCNKDSVKCDEPFRYVFFDAAHPTQAAYNVIAKKFQRNLLYHLMS